MKVEVAVLGLGFGGGAEFEKETSESSLHVVNLSVQASRQTDIE